MSNLVILIGIPGCGKSTWAKTLFDLKYKVVSSDEIRARQAGSLKDAHAENIRPWDVFYREIADALNHNIDVIADATFLTVKHRNRVRGIAEATGSAIHAVLFKNIWDALDRNKARDDDRKVPADVMEAMVGLYWDTLARLPQEGYKTVTWIETFS